MGQIICLAIGYGFGCILFGEIVARIVAHKSAAELGTTGNPGMANIMASCGFGPGIAVLAGDLVKTAAAIFLSYYLAGGEMGRMAMLYAGFGCTLGHDFPFWRKFRGGKGVATSCAAFILFRPLIGIPACLVGLAVVIATKYLSLGALAIPAAFTVGCLIAGNTEAAALGVFFTVISLFKNLDHMCQIPSGEAERVDVIAAVKKKWGKKEAPAQETESK